ncbi:DUF922 domain-containing protein [Candidatus Bipolaricaulota bacterium]
MRSKSCGLLLLGLLLAIIAMGCGERGGPVLVGASIDWSPDRPLGWDDFKGEVPGEEERGDKSASTLHETRYRYTPTITQTPSGRYRATIQTGSYTTTTTMIQTGSWVVPTDKTDALLSHEQRHFDLGEVYRRKLAAALQKLEGEGDTPEAADEDLARKAEELRRAMHEAEREQQDRYDQETDHGRNDEKQQEWDDRIEGWLDDPSSAPGPP